MKPVFLTHSTTFEGDYRMILRTPESESNEGYHYHDFYDLHFFYCPVGPADRIGTAFIHDREYDIMSGDALLIRIFDPHRFQLDRTADYLHYAVSINAPLMLYLCSESENLVSVFSPENPK